MLSDSIIKAFDRININVSGGMTDIIQLLYYDIFNEWCQYIYNIKHGNITDEVMPVNDTMHPSDDDDISYNVENFHKFVIDNGYIHYMINYDHIYINTMQRVIIRQYKYKIMVFCSLAIDDDHIKELQAHLIPIKTSEEESEVGILTHRNSAYFVEHETFPKMDIDITRTYNDDLPMSAFDDFVVNDDKGLILLYGEPGTGKTTFIKYLIQKYPDKNFIILDSQLLHDISSHSLLSTFIEYKDSIYILEDCEKLLRSREDMSNPIISTLLNMSDGILASIIKCKFICTFNTDLNNIDAAIKRKGRMKLKYEFKKLDKEKCKKIDDTITEDMSIADVINIKKENDFSKKKTQRMGFH